MFVPTSQCDWLSKKVGVACLGDVSLAALPEQALTSGTHLESQHASQEKSRKAAQRVMRVQAIISVLRPAIRHISYPSLSSPSVNCLFPRSSRFLGTMAENLGWTPVADGKYDYDLITIGIGSGGTRASRIASTFGAKVSPLSTETIIPSHIVLDHRPHVK